MQFAVFIMRVKATQGVSRTSLNGLRLRQREGKETRKILERGGGGGVSQRDKIR